MVLLAHKRYIHKQGKRHGPYYYKNVRDESGNVKSVYLGKVSHRGKKPLKVVILFLFLTLIIISALLYGRNARLDFLLSQCPGLWSLHCVDFAQRRGKV